MTIKTKGRTLVSGANGFIGSHLVEALLKKGRNIRALVRIGEKAKHLEKMQAEIVYGNLLNDTSIKNALEGVDKVYHLAAVIPRLRRSSKDIYKINVLGTKSLLQECIKSGVKKFIYFSSIAAVGPRNQPILIDEGSPYIPKDTYGESKYEAEKLVLIFSTRYSLSSIIIRPPLFVYGPRDFGLLRLFQFMKKGRFYFISGMKEHLMSFCYVKNLIQGTILAGEDKDVSNGEIFFLSDIRPYTIGELVQTAADILKVRVSGIIIPKWVANMVRIFLEGLEAIRIPLPVSPNTIRIMTPYWLCNINKAKKQLGYLPQIDLREGLEETIRWYRDKGYL